MDVRDPTSTVRRLRGRIVQLTWTAVACATVLLPACGAAGPSRGIGELRALGVHAQEDGGGWYRLRSDDGYRFRMPGLPLAAREQYVFGGAEVETLFYDLSAELNSRGYLVRAFDASRLDEAGKGELRQQAERMIMESFEEASEPRRVAHHGVEAYERTLQGLTINGHWGILRTMVWDRFVFQILAILPAAAGDPSDARGFLESVVLSQDRGAPPVHGSSATGAN